MAFSASDANKVWQQVQISLDALGASGLARDTFRALKAALAQTKGNPQLQFLPFSEADADVAGGTVLLSGACRLYGVYTKKENSATDNVTKVYDDATDDTTAGDDILALPQFEANVGSSYVNSSGIPMATGIVITQHTTVEGSTDGSNGANGFLIIGAA